MTQETDLIGASGATFSPDRMYRYDLWRRWGEIDQEHHHPLNGYLGFVMLNPSTADAIDNDPTVERCERRAKAWGFGGIVVVNLFALRSTDPAALRKHPDPVGWPANDEYIMELSSRCTMVVCGWGIHGTLNGRARKVYSLLRDAGVIPMCLGVTKGGQPRHPLYVSYKIKPVLWQGGNIE